ncbi:LysR substrate-binding domain-containing protein [Thiorhodococcus minor]|uniref:LysR family transcriptional regulator n=1 Tax=Thiorhodococcus minor TaxID=57489 RepID=A0A6M0K2G4_9GAMM|nr:LysR substrate-binding domain-containing protein [Thiorhodococcus minor]NEV63541.1 LysR family transcriptional regulator [Thiorhodococcus minor]
MELRQLRSLVTLVDTQFNVSRAAERLHLVQSAVTQHLKHLETEIGGPLFLRHGKRLVGLTELGERVMCYADAIMRQTSNIQAAGCDFAEQDQGILRLGATHTQARYVLPPVIRRFVGAYPEVELQIHQGTPAQLVDLTLRDRVDLAICTEALGSEPGLRAIPCYRWNRALIAPRAHPLLDAEPLTLARLCEHPIITYVFGFTGRSGFSDAFAKAGLRPRVVLSAADTDVIKAYVREGLGIGIIAALAYRPTEDLDLGMRDLSALFPWETTKVAHAWDKHLRNYHKHFIDLFKAETGEGGDCERTFARRPAAVTQSKPCDPVRA